MTGSPAAMGPGNPASAAHRRTALVLVAIALVLHALLAWLAREPGVATRQDDAMYLLLARSLLDGGYHEIFRTDAPAHDQYPPGYPALLAGWQVIAGDGYDGFLVLGVAVSVLALILTYRVVSLTVGRLIAVAAVLVLAVNPSLIEFAGGIRSETPYMLLTVVALALLARPERGRATLGLAAMAAVLAAMTRSIGITLAVAVIAELLWTRQWRAALGTALLSAAIIGSWLAFTTLSPEQYAGSSYVAEIRSLEGGSTWIPPIVTRVPATIRSYAVTGLPTHLAIPTIADTPVDNAVAAILWIPALIAGLWAFRSRWRAALLYVLCYGGLMAVWVWVADRFVIPLLVFLVPAILLGFRNLASRAGPRAGTITVCAVAAVLVASGATTSTRMAIKRQGCERPDDFPPAACILRDQASWIDAARYVRDHTAEGATFLTAKPEPLYYHTGRRSISFEGGLALPDSAFLTGLRERGVEYILLGSVQHREPGRLADLVEGGCQGLDVVGFFPERTWLFRLRPAGAELADGGPACQAVSQYRAANAGRDFERDP